VIGLVEVGSGAGLAGVSTVGVGDGSAVVVVESAVPQAIIASTPTLIIRTGSSLTGRSMAELSKKTNLGPDEAKSSR
jgi:hypothetical protein